MASNPYLDAYNACNRGFTESSKLVHAWEERHHLVRRYSWAVPNDAAIGKLVEHSPIIEIGAGTGYWASLVQAAGGDIIAFDFDPPALGKSNNHFHPDTKQHFPVQRSYYLQMAGFFPNHALFLCWPPYDEVMAFQALLGYTGKTVIFVGEDRGGCTANDEFFDKLDHEFDLVETVNIPQWYGIHDCMYVYRRKV